MPPAGLRPTSSLTSLRSTLHRLDRRISALVFSNEQSVGVTGSLNLSLDLAPEDCLCVLESNGRRSVLVGNAKDVTAGLEYPAQAVLH